MEQESGAPPQGSNPEPPNAEGSGVTNNGNFVQIDIPAAPIPQDDFPPTHQVVANTPNSNADGKVLANKMIQNATGIIIIIQ